MVLNRNVEGRPGLDHPNGPCHDRSHQIMAHVSLPQAVTRPNVGAALRTFRLSYANSPRELNAINRAALNLESCFWQFSGAELVIESATQTGLVKYHVQHDACDCAAAAHGKACWHRAAYRLLSKAAAMAQQPRQPKYSAAEYSRIMAEAAELA